LTPILGTNSSKLSKSKKTTHRGRIGGDRLTSAITRKPREKTEGTAKTPKKKKKNHTNPTHTHQKRKKKTISGVYKEGPRNN